VNASGNTGVLNDLWEFNPATNEWTWIGGNKTGESEPHSIDGTEGLPGVSVDPGPDYMATGWADGFGDLWLFGGNTLDGEGDSNDFWVFDPAIHEWGWMTGGMYGDQPGVYGALGQAGRQREHTWKPRTSSRVGRCQWQFLALRRTWRRC